MFAALLAAFWSTAGFSIITTMVKKISFIERGLDAPQSGAAG